MRHIIIEALEILLACLLIAGTAVAVIVFRPVARRRRRHRRRHSSRTKIDLFASVPKDGPPPEPDA